MDNVPIDVLQAVVAHATNQEPRADVRVLLNSEWLLTLTTTIYVERCEMAGELTAVLSNEAPFREFLLFRALDV